MRTVTKLNTGWLFHLNDAADADFMGYDDRAWTPVTLPHDWAVAAPFDRANASGTGYLPGGIGWYRKHFTLPEDSRGKRVVLRFEGVYKHARVWINSYYLGQHAYGYTSFSFDVSDFVRPGENVIALRAEHSEAADSRWYTGSGIQRPVELEIMDPVCFREVFARTRSLGPEGAVLDVDWAASGAERVRFRLTAPDGREAVSAAAVGETGRLSLTVPEPRLWSPEAPFLYTLTGEAEAEGRVTDRISLPAGLRTARFDPAEGFFLNGWNLKIKGVCVHHDAGCLGAAVPKSVWRRRLQKLKEAGCNAIRTAHNPPDPALLDLCDELGFLVMDEAFDEWEGTKNKWWQGHNVYPPKHFGYAEDFPQWHRADLESMVKRDRNHPCVILWSIGNEVDYPNDPYVTPLFRETLGNNDANKPAAERIYDPRKPDAARLVTVARELTDIVHALDDSRPVTSALSFPELSNRTGFADVLDVSGYNYRERFYEEDHARWPDRVILGSENSHDPACWYAVRDHAYISAQFLWTGIDFLGECRGWPVRISQAGMLDLAGYEKPLFFRRKALWTGEPFARLAAGDGIWDARFRWQGEEGETKQVFCLTNETEAELFLNGISLGRRQLTDEDGCMARWEVPYAPGVLRVATPHAEDRLETAGPAAALSVTADVQRLPADGMSVVQAEVRLLDAEGRPAAGEERVRCQLLGDGELLGLENGRPDDLTPYSMPWRDTYNGRLILYVRAGKTPGPLTVYLRTDSGLRTSLDLTLA